MKRDAAVLFARAIGRSDIDRLWAQMRYLNDYGAAEREVQRWHMEAGHPVAGRSRCSTCGAATLLDEALA